MDLFFFENFKSLILNFLFLIIFWGVFEDVNGAVILSGFDVVWVRFCILFMISFGSGNFKGYLFFYFSVVDFLD